VTSLSALSAIVTEDSSAINVDDGLASVDQQPVIAMAVTAPSTVNTASSNQADDSSKHPDPTEDAPLIH
jgi:hypothetical protein